MSKPYSEDDFSGQITEDRSWRLKEISDLKDAIVRADEKLQRVLLRALVTICYAHWEGYVRLAGRKYLEHIALRKFQYDELDRQFLRNYFLPRLAALSTSKTSLLDRCNLVDEILNSSNRRFSKVNEDLINTKANLNYDVFVDICLVCGISTELFADQKVFLDIVLLKRRNEIAHGEETFVSIEDLDELATRTIALMRGFGDLLENRVYLKDYRAA
jgi:HEPN superfamily RiboL-PSP-like protein